MYQPEFEAGNEGEKRTNDSRPGRKPCIYDLTIEFHCGLSGSKDDLLRSEGGRKGTVS